MKSEGIRRWLVLPMITLVCAAGALIAGCGRSEAEEYYPTITIYYSVYVSSESTMERVSEAISEVTREKIGCNVSLAGSSGDYADSIKSMVHSYDEADLYFIKDYDLFQYVVSGDYMLALNDYLTDYPVLQASVEESAWEQTSEIIYGIPDNKDQSYYMGFVCRRSYLDELGIEIDESRIYTMDELHEILLQIHEYDPDLIPVGSHLGEIAESVGEDPCIDSIAVLLPDEDGNYKDQLENLYASDLFYDWCSTMYAWRQEGLLDEYMTQNAEAQTVYLAQNVFGYFANVKYYVTTNNAYISGQDLVAIRLSEDRADNNLNSIHWCVSGNTAYPEYAVALLNLLFTDQEINDLFHYGVEGVDYYLDDDGQPVLNRETENPYYSTGWVWPDLSRQTDSESTVVTSPAYGFVYDASSVQVEYDLCREIRDIYRDALMAGEIDPDLAIPQMLSELEEAGINAVLEDKQAQLDDYINRS